ncbi:DAK2 domain-containing protein [Herbinix luporum]|uniref:DAK2 domain-containing protein n=1 Tax=Herbinix luporum TaxID=1679721 RepID=UPI0017523486|nr:DAK2 domain-containing protein [Herbinix luporum]HHT57935.1 DAK2 domain-containing protein [Herbinix luporum]
MIVKTIDAKTFKKMFLAGAACIEAKKEYINELNVFPVPDGDTGTNMTLTIMAAVKEVNSLNNPSIEELSKAISGGSLRGARGNSGVILSQLFRGFTKEIRNYDELNVAVITNGLKKAVETAYRAVMKPKEGTILTVARGAAEKAAELALKTDDLVYFCQEVIAHMEDVLARTPDMLPVLKEAQVVDSGGQGLLEIVKGAYAALLGKEITPVATNIEEKSVTGINIERVAQEDIKFGYCTEFIIMVEKEYNLGTEQEFKSYLESIGDSIVVVSDEDIVKVHVHTNDPGLAIQKALTYGSLTNMKIDNMREEHNEKVIKDAQKAANEADMAAKDDTNKPVEEKPRKKAGFIAVSMGEGLDEIFTGLGVDYIIEGGQTMNPSTEDMLNAIDQVNADNIFILPNNSNIILTAEQAKQLTEDKNIIVIPSKTVPQGITAIINFVYDKSPEENAERMTEEMNRVKSGQVTYAIRDTVIDGREIKQGNIMGLGDKTIHCVGDDIKKTTIELISSLVDDESELISLYYGVGVTDEEADEICDELVNLYPDLDVEVHYGGQPIYYYLLSVE